MNLNTYAYLAGSVVILLCLWVIAAWASEGRPFTWLRRYLRTWFPQLPPSHQEFTEARRRRDLAAAVRDEQAYRQLDRLIEDTER